MYNLKNHVVNNISDDNFVKKKYCNYKPVAHVGSICDQNKTNKPKNKPNSADDSSYGLHSNVIIWGNVIFMMDKIYNNHNKLYHFEHFYLAIFILLTI